MITEINICIRWFLYNYYKYIFNNFEYFYKIVQTLNKCLKCVRLTVHNIAYLIVCLSKVVVEVLIAELRTLFSRTYSIFIINIMTNTRSPISMGFLFFNHFVRFVTVGQILSWFVHEEKTRFSKTFSTISYIYVFLPK